MLPMLNVFVQILFPLDDCLTVLRSETIVNIETSLREWRKMPYRRTQVLRRLQEFQRLYLRLFRIKNACDLNSLDPMVRDISRLWTTEI